MLIDIERITVEDRIRSEFGNLRELADDIRDNGLINPPVVTPEYRLIAGERRLRAMKLLGWKQVVVNIMTVRDYEHQLRLEISENENRKEFTYTERVAWAKRLEQVEALKAKERIKQGAEIGAAITNTGERPVENFPQGESGKTRDKVAQATGFGSGKQYEKAKYVADHADPETLEAWDKGDISTHAAYKDLQAKLKQAEQERDTAQRSAQTFQAKWIQERSNPVITEVVPDDVKTELAKLQGELYITAEEKKAALVALQTAQQTARQYHQNWMRDKENGGAVYVPTNPAELLERCKRALDNTNIHEASGDLVLPPTTLARHQMILDFLELVQTLTGR